ncbi:hypothetical protein MTP10_12945 [Nonomuraea sp. 3-1Str]|uniref:hypothetical protein n=1 Tax=Nonomuraea sp. 3-1Str TaxID=2929801 RepID=UPI002855FE03|nr:hypothetical protein [Nonomuraea sp. 3-1Str]MDR8409646.1 hypothetical protein [Nonomuraea sp. 3-1Str]
MARIRLAASAVALAAALLPLGSPPAAGASAEVVEYSCSGESVPAQTVRVRVTLTMPASAVVGQPFSIGWRAEYEAGAELKAPSSGLSAGVSLYAHAGISGLPQLTSATGTAPLGAITPGQAIPLPASVEMTTTARNAGTGAVRPGAINIGTMENDPLIECEVRTPGALSAYTLTVAAGTGTDPDTSPSSDVSSSESSSADASSSETSSETDGTSEPESTRKRSSAVPKAGADTGGGGEAGPDGRALVLGGSVLIMGAGLGGLLARRPRPAGAPARDRA